MPAFAGIFVQPPHRPRVPPGSFPGRRVGACAWRSRLVAGRWLLSLRDLGEGDHLRRSLAMKPFPVALRNKLREGELPGLLPMVGEPAEFLWVQTQFARHLDMQVAQVK